MFLAAAGPFIYAPVLIASIIMYYGYVKHIWLHIAIVTGLAVALNVKLFLISRANVALAKYIKNPNADPEVKKAMAMDFFPLLVYLYNQQYVFIDAGLEDNVLVLNFFDHGTPIRLTGYDYRVVRTTDESIQHRIVLTEQGITVYLPHVHEVSYGGYVASLRGVLIEET